MLLLSSFEVNIVTVVWIADGVEQYDGGLVWGLCQSLGAHFSMLWGFRAVVVESSMDGDMGVVS